MHGPSHFIGKNEPKLVRGQESPYMLRTAGNMFGKLRSWKHISGRPGVLVHDRELAKERAGEHSGGGNLGILMVGNVHYYWRNGCDTLYGQLCNGVSHADLIKNLRKGSRARTREGNGVGIRARSRLHRLWCEHKPDFSECCPGGRNQ